jgi:hypothetical protein
MGNKSIWIVGWIRQWFDSCHEKVAAMAARETARLSRYEFRS